MVRWGVVIFGIILIAWRTQVIRSHANFEAGQRVVVRFTVRQVPKISFGQQRFSFRGISVAIPESTQIEYGDYVQASGTLESKVSEPKRKILELKIDTFSVYPANFSLLKQINGLRLFLISKLKLYLPPDEAGLAAGILLGGNQDMTQAQILAYRRAGLSHIVAASGYNVTLVVGWSIWFFRKLVPRAYLLPLVILTIVFYGFLAGGSAAIMRAVVMGIIAAIGLALGRESDVRWILILTALIMLIANPEYVSDIGFQLSIAATAGLVFFQPQKALSTTLVAQLATLPIILHHFGNLSLIAPLTNILVLWTVPVIMQVTAVAVITGGWLAYLAWPLLKWCNWVTYFFAHWKYSSLTLEPVGWIWVVGYYVVVIIVYYWRTSKHAT